MILSAGSAESGWGAIRVSVFLAGTSSDCYPQGGLENARVEGE